MTSNSLCQHTCNLTAPRPFQASTKHPRRVSSFRFPVQASQGQNDTLRSWQLHIAFLEAGGDSSVAILRVTCCRQSFTKHAVAAMLALSLSANPAFAASVTARGASSASAEASSSADSSDNTTPIYFGNGCFWGRQKDFVDVEKALGREGGKISAITGYAGGAKGAGNICCVSVFTEFSDNMPQCSLGNDTCGDTCHCRPW